jgi:hypothetical protein
MACILGKHLEEALAWRLLEIGLPPKICCHIWAASWFMAKRKTGFVMDWLDDTQYWDPNSDLELRLSLIREDTHTFLRGTLHLLIRMDIFCEYCFVFG